jgi:hypothetical protein
MIIAIDGESMTVRYKFNDLNLTSLAMHMNRGFSTLRQPCRSSSTWTMSNLQSDKQPIETNANML